MSKAKNKIVEQAKKRYERISYEQLRMREKGELCNKMIAGEQWESDDIRSREDTNRPMITINKLESPVNIVANKNSMERSRIKVAPFEDADKDTAKVINGLIRHIQYSEKSNADLAYSQAFSDATGRGYGYLRVNTDYCNDDTFDQEIIIEKIEDPDSVYLDPDGNFCFVTDWIKKEEFEERYPEADPVSWDDTDTKDVFFKDDDVCVAEYWVKEESPETIYKIKLDQINPIGQDVSLNNLDQILQPQQPQQEVLVVTKEELDQFNEDFYKILAERKTKNVKIKQYIIGGDQILEENDWAGKYIPIIGVYGKKYKIDGHYFYKSLIYDAIDPQKMYNYYRSQEAEMLMQQPKAPWIGAEGQFEGHEEEWARANVDQVPYLEYKPQSVSGQLAPPPQRQLPPQVQAGFVQSVQQSSDEIKATTGLFDASLGAQGNEKSGKAILARQQQGEMGTYHFTMSFNEALRKTGLILVDLIPRIYDTARTIRILGEDMAEEVVKINQSFVNKDGQEVLYDLTTGTYDVKIETGPALNTRRMDAAENLIQLTQYVPSAGPVTADLIVKNLDVEYSDELAMRLKASIPPELFTRIKQLEAEEKGGMSPEQMQLQQLQQQLQQAGQQIQQAQQIMTGMKNENEQLKKAAQNNKIQETQIKARADVESTRIKTQGEIEQEQIRARAGNIQNRPPVLMR